MTETTTAMQQPLFNKIVIIGLGLIGSSIARALKTKQAVETIVGIDNNPDMLMDGQTLGVIDEIGTIDGASFENADIVIISVPMGAIDSIVSQALPLISADTVITDVASAKQSVVDAFRATTDGKTPTNFVPGHPISGTEHNGVRAGFATLFENRACVLTPLPSTDSTAMTTVQTMWEICGAKVATMDISHHDSLFAATSHLPHMLAYTLVDALAKKSDKQEIFKFAAGGFRDFTRIASSDPIMWRDVALLNKTAILEMLAVYRQELDELTADIKNNNAAAIEARFRNAKAARDALL
jgi:prephenate dehydrogenase